MNLIILDDAFQHRYVESWVNILLMDYNNPIYHDSFRPRERCATAAASFTGPISCW